MMAANNNWDTSFDETMNEIWKSFKDCLDEFPELAVYQESVQETIKPPAQILEGLAPLRNLCITRLLENIRQEAVEEESRSESGEVDKEKDRREWDVKNDGGEERREDREEEDIKKDDGEENGVRDEQEDYRKKEGDRTEEGEKGETNENGDEGDRAKGGVETQGKWGSMGEELLALDKQIRVPRDDVNTQTIFEAVRVLPELIKHRLAEEFPLLPVEIFQMGSFPCDAKIVEIDEFDFMLICETEDDEEVEMIKELSYGIISSLCVMNEVDDVTRMMLYKTGMLHGSEPHVSGAYRHGPAMCSELSWRCQHGHVHEIGVDVTVTRRSKTRRLREMCAGLQEMPVYKDVYYNIPEDEGVVYLGTDTTTCVLDERVARRLADLSPNISATYRLLKLLNKAVLPCSLTAHSKHSRMELSPIVSSHNLKQALLRHVAEYPCPEHWRTEVLHIRLAQILRHLKIGTQDSNFIKGEATRDGTQWLKSIIVDVRSELVVDPIGDHSDNITALAEMLETAYTGQAIKHHIPETASPIPHNVDILMLIKGRLHPYKLEDPFLVPLVFGCDGSSLAYKLQRSQMSYMQHPLMRWCREFVLQKYRTDPGADLTKVSNDCLTLVILLYLAGFLCHEDIQRPFSCMDIVTQFNNTSAVFGDINSVYGTFAFGLNQKIMIEQFIKTELYRRYNSWNPLETIRETLPYLTNRERAFVLRQCCKIVTAADDYGKFASLRKLPSEGDGEERLYRTLHSVNYAHVMFQRLQGKSVNGNFLHYNILVFYVIGRLLQDPGYFSQITPSEEAWAQEQEQMLLQGEIIPVDKTVNSPDGRLVKVEWDERNLFRCIAIYGISDLRKTPRTLQGCGLNIAEEAAECFLADKIKSLVTELLDREAAGVREFSSQSDLEVPGLYRRGEFQYVTGVVYLSKTPVHLYRCDADGRDQLMCKVTHPSFSQRSPIILCYTSDINQTHSCDLFLVNTHLSEDLWVIDQNKNPFEKVLNQITDTEKLVSFCDFLEYNKRS